MSAARKERREAERAMKKLTRPSGKHNCGVRQVADLGMTDLLVQATSAAITAFGMPPNSAEVTAAHEAGHLIVGLAHGGVFGECWIKNDAAGWQGFNHIHVNGVHTRKGENYQPAKEPVRATFYTAQLLGGIAGEMVIGKYHPASSLEEFTTATVFANSMDRGDPASVLQSIIEQSTSVIEANRIAFDHARGLLERNHRITSTEAEDIRAMLVHKTDALRLLLEAQS